MYPSGTADRPLLAPFPPPAVSLPAPRGLDGVGFWRRAVAQAIDLAVLSATRYVTGFLIGLVLVAFRLLTHRPVNPPLQKLDHTTFLTFSMAILGFLAYHTVCEGLYGSSLGKLLLGITVITENQLPCGLAAAAQRSLAMAKDGLFFGLVAAVNMSLSRPLRQRIGDKWAQTLVVRRKELKPEQKRPGWLFVVAFIGGIALNGLFLAIGTTITLIG
jgi:uncharacterized RDD family membrane protein YckC